MKVLVYGINFRPELTGIGKYSGEMADWFARKGHEVRVVTAPPYYPEWRVAKGFSRGYHMEDGNPRVYRCPLYVPAEPGMFTRILHLLSFALSSFFALLRLLPWRADVVIVVEPSLFCAPAALLYGRMTRAVTVLHIQDFEVDAMFGLGMMRVGRLAAVARAVEGWLMRRFDRVSTISRSMMRNAKGKGVAPERLVFFPNWVDTDFISPAADSERYRLRWNIPRQTRVVLYSGNMGRKQGLDIVLKAAARLQDHPDLLFVMVGEGAARKELEDQALSLGLRNVRFEPLQPYPELPCLLRLADIHLVVQRRGAADVVLPSKLTGILSAGGHALITSEPETELGLLVQEHPRIATCVAPEDIDAFCSALQSLLLTNTAEVNQVARDYAVRYLSQDGVLGEFESCLSVLVASQTH